MDSLRWSWLAAPYLVSAALIAAVVLATALTRGDRVMRLGVIAAATTALPWASRPNVVSGVSDPVAVARAGAATALMRPSRGPA